jgi:macrodomain Ter protein organizer (MatP/YcbG family)
VKPCSSSTEKLVRRSWQIKDVASDGIGAVQLASAAVERQPLAVAVFIDQHHSPELRRQLMQTTRPHHLLQAAEELAGLR